MKSLSEIVAILPADIATFRNFTLEKKQVIKEKIGKDLIDLINEMTKAFGDIDQATREARREAIIALTVMFEEENLEDIKTKWNILEETRIFDSMGSTPSSPAKKIQDRSKAFRLINEAIIAAETLKEKPHTSYYEARKQLQAEEAKAIQEKDEDRRKFINTQLNKINKAIHTGKLLSGLTISSSMKRLALMINMLNTLNHISPKFVLNHNAGMDNSLKQQMENLNIAYTKLLGDLEEDPSHENHQKNLELAFECEIKAKTVLETFIDAIQFSLPFLASRITPSNYNPIEKNLEKLTETFSQSIDQPTLLSIDGYQTIINKFQQDYLDLAQDIDTSHLRPEEVTYREQQKKAAIEADIQLPANKFTYRMKLIDSNNHFIQTQRALSEKAGELQNKNKFIFYRQSNPVSMEKDTQRDLKIAGQDLRRPEPEELLALLTNYFPPDEYSKTEFLPLLIQDFVTEIPKSKQEKAQLVQQKKQELIDKLDQEFGKENRINLMNHYDQGPALLISSAVEKGLRTDHQTDVIPLIIRPPKKFSQNIYMKDDVVYRDAELNYLRIAVGGEELLGNEWIFKTHTKILLWITKDGYIAEGMGTDSALICNAIMQENTHSNLKNIVSSVIEFDEALQETINSLSTKRAADKKTDIQNKAKLALLHSLQAQILGFKKGQYTFDELIDNTKAIHEQSKAFNNETIPGSVLNTLTQESNEIALFVNTHLKKLTAINENMKTQAKNYLNKKSVAAKAYQPDTKAPASPSRSSSASTSVSSSTMINEESKEKLSELPLQETINILSGFNSSKLQAYNTALEKKDIASQQTGRFNTIIQNINKFRFAYDSAFTRIINNIKQHLKDEYKKTHNGKEKEIGIFGDDLMPFLEQEMRNIINYNPNIDLEKLYNNLVLIMSISFPINQSHTVGGAQEEAYLTHLGAIINWFLEEEKRNEARLQMVGSSVISASSKPVVQAAHLDWFIHRIEQIQFWYAIQGTKKHINDFQKLLDEFKKIKNSGDTLEKKFLDFATHVKTYWNKGHKHTKTKNKDVELIEYLNQHPNDHSFLRELGALLQDFTKIYNKCYILDSNNRRQSQLDQFPIFTSLILPNREIILPKFSEQASPLLFASLCNEVGTFAPAQPLARYLHHLRDQLISYVDAKIYTPSQAFSELATEVKRLHIQGNIESKKWLPNDLFKNKALLADLNYLVQRIESQTLPLPKIVKEPTPTVTKAVIQPKTESKDDSEAKQQISHPEVDTLFNPTRSTTQRADNSASSSSPSHSIKKRTNT